MPEPRRLSAVSGTDEYRAVTRIFMKKSRRIQQYKKFLLAYSILFILSGVLVFRYFPMSGKKMVWKGDGLSQHYVALCYYARWGRAVLKSLFSGHPAFPTFNLHMGYGSDLFTTLQYYVIGDPFSLPAVLVPQRHMLFFHDAMILVRIYLAGLCFNGYCRYMGHRNLTGNLCGTLVYTFCSFALFGMRHPYFLNAMIWFPLLLLGAEHIFRGRRGRLFTLAVFLSCMSNFYFFYMLVLMVIAYAVWRALSICLFPALRAGGADSTEGKSSGGAGVGAALLKIAGYALKFMWRAVFGVAMGACFLLPILLRFTGDPRASEGTARGIFYALSYYKSIPESFIAFGTDAMLDNWTCMGFGAVGLICVLLLFLNRKGEGCHKTEKDFGKSEKGSDETEKDFGKSENGSDKTGKDFGKSEQGSDKTGKKDFGKGGKGSDKTGKSLTGTETDLSKAGEAFHLKLAFAGLMLLVLFPLAGTALNGFSYPANRWIWALAMLTGYITAVMVPEFVRISFKKGAVLVVCLAVYGAVCFVLGAHKSTLAEVVLGMAVVIAVTALGAAAAGAEGTGRRSEKRKNRRESGGSYGLPCLMQTCVLIAAILVTEAIHAYIEFIPGRMHSGLEEYHSAQYIEAMKASDSAGIRGLIGNETFYRYSGRDLANNFSILHDVSNTQYYWSLSDGGIEQFFTETGQGNGMVHLYDNLDNRTFPDEIAGVRYYIRSDGSLLPFGYEKCAGLHYDNRELFAEKEGDPLPVFSFSVYENKYALPLGFTTRNYISRETYEGLPIPQKQEALMQGVVLETGEMQAQSAADLKEQGTAASKEQSSADLKEQGTAALKEQETGPAGLQQLRLQGKDEDTEADGRLVFTSEELPFEFDAEEGIEVRPGEDGSLQLAVRSTDAALRLRTGDTSRREVSLLFTGMEYQAPEEGFREDESYSNTEPVTIHVRAERDDETVSVKKVEYTLADNPWKTGRSDFLSCCGYSEKSLTGLRLDFSRRGIYTFKELKVIGQPMENYPSQAEALREHVLEETDLHELPGSGATSRITGRVTLPESRILCIQIPCCRGLRAFVDGEKQQLLKADTMFCALALGPGTHEIELRYTTPGLIPGAAVSAIAILLFLAESAAAARRKAQV